MLVKPKKVPHQASFTNFLLFVSLQIYHKPWKEIIWLNDYSSHFDYTFISKQTDTTNSGNEKLKKQFIIKLGTCIYRTRLQIHHITTIHTNKKHVKNTS